MSPLLGVPMHLDVVLQSGCHRHKNLHAMWLLLRDPTDRGTSQSQLQTFKYRLFGIQ